MYSFGDSLKEVGTWGLGTGGTQKKTKVGGWRRVASTLLYLIGGTTQTFLYGVTGYLPVKRPRLRDVTYH